jgi:hypothetical protein
MCYPNEPLQQPGVPQHPAITRSECVALLDRYGFGSGAEPGTFHTPDGRCTVQLSEPCAARAEPCTDEPCALVVYAFDRHGGWHVALRGVPYPVVSHLIYLAEVHNGHHAPAAR